MLKVGSWTVMVKSANLPLGELPARRIYALHVARFPSACSSAPPLQQLHSQCGCVNNLPWHVHQHGMYREANRPYGPSRSRYLQCGRVYERQSCSARIRTRCQSGNPDIVHRWSHRLVTVLQGLPSFRIQYMDNGRLADRLTETYKDHQTRFPLPSRTRGYGIAEKHAMERSRRSAHFKYFRNPCEYVYLSLGVPPLIIDRSIVAGRQRVSHMDVGDYEPRSRAEHRGQEERDWMRDL
ncbi:hypothetical protein PENSPDRAFT_492444 [Peniophora sp. CONT]|nr:hypothetical protein PENSPDRAFT_492444 [Peniophora sp. CONT]